MAVAVDIVDAGDAGPEFVLTEPRGRPGGLRARVGSRPVVGSYGGCGVRGVFERVVGFVERTGFDREKFAVDRDHGVAEAVDFG